MKQFLLSLFAITLLFAACQKEQLTVIQNADESVFIKNGELTRVLMSVSAHDGSFDDNLDQASCFSINFPYEIILNGEPYQVNSPTDLEIITPTDTIWPVYPITLTLADHSTRELTHIEQYFSLKTQCDSGILFSDLITCVDLQYPFSMAVFDPVANDFTTIVMAHDSETFTHMSDLQEDNEVSINFPIRLSFPNGTTVTINSHNQLLERILAAVSNCN